jgi:hypothetical protein
MPERRRDFDDSHAQHQADCDAERRRNARREVLEEHPQDLAAKVGKQRAGEGAEQGDEEHGKPPGFSGGFLWIMPEPGKHQQSIEKQQFFLKFQATVKLNSNTDFMNG